MVESSPQIDAIAATQRTRTLAQLIQERQTFLENDPERQQWSFRTKEVIRYGRPDLSQWLEDNDPIKGQSNTRYMYTSRPVTDLERAADAFCGNVFTPHGWFGLEMADPRLSGKCPIPELKTAVDNLLEWLQACEEHMYSIYASSNFYAAMPPVAMDSMSIGDGLLYIGNDLDESLPFFEYREALGVWWKRNRFGRLDIVHEKITLTAYEAHRRWRSAVSESVKVDVVRDPMKNHSFVHAVYPKDDPILEGLRFVRPRPFIELWIELDARENLGHENRAYEGALDRMGGIIEQDGYFTMPFADWPYWLKSGETQGRGPLGSAIYTLKRCHAEHKQVMLAGQKSISPPMWASGTLRGKIDLSPSGPGSGITYGEDPNRDILKESQPNIRYPFGVDQLDRTEREISDVLQLDFFLMMSQTTKEMTIPEVIERIGERAAALSPRIGLMQKLLLDQCHARVWQIERINKRLPEPPDVLYELAYEYGFDPTVSVRYKGPLAQAQEQVFMQRRIVGAFQTVQPFMALDPQAVRAKINSAVAVERILDLTGFPQDAINSDDEYQAIISAQNEADAELHQTEVAKGMADAQHKMAKANKENVKAQKESNEP